jgi:Fe-S-cluster-containing dehydrogenase component
MLTKQGFIFDYSKCVGCHACIVACSLENGVNPPLSWRKVNQFNKEKLPLLGFVHQSIACNHCLEAPCMKACPSDSFSFDKQTGAVIHNQERCLGCKYCTWACPFEAPKYNDEKGIIEKCHFCYHRLKEGKIPSCALNCPTGALSFGQIEEQAQPMAIGFSKKKIYPKINVFGDEVVHNIPEIDIKVSGIEKTNLKKTIIKYEHPIIDALDEWPLVLFTFIGSLITGWFWGMMLPNSIQIPFWAFFSLSFIALILSTFHLGKPFRSYLSILNLKNSWLSREILFFGLFFSIGIVTFQIENNVLDYLTSLMGFLFLISIEFVYSVREKKNLTLLHSANTVATALTYTALLTELWTILILLLALKTLAFTIRNRLFSLFESPLISIISFTRMIFGIFIPISFVVFTEYKFSWWIFTSIILGEIIDRFMFYMDFKRDRIDFNISNSN